MDKVHPQVWKDADFKLPCKEKDFLLGHNNGMKKSSKKQVTFITLDIYLGV